MVGPVIGSVIYGLVKYEWTFYIFAIGLAVAGVGVFFMLPSRLNRIDEMKDAEAAELAANDEENT
jgi:uncharacterized membrane protein YgaE (UPF0421/DUF939 family)